MIEIGLVSVCRPLARFLSLLLQKIFIAALFCFSTLPMKEDTKKHEKANPNLAINLVNLSNSFNKELAHKAEDPSVTWCQHVRLRNIK